MSEFVVELVKDGYVENVELELPASFDEIADALEEARVSGKEHDYFVEILASPIKHLQLVIPESADIYELNYLAERLSGFDGWQRDCFAGLCAMETAKAQAELIPLERLINLTFNLKECQVVYEAKDDKTLGKFYAENDFIPELEGVSDKVYGWLDFGQIGKEMREAEGGVHMPFGYVVLNGEISTEYTSDMCPRPNDSPEAGQKMGGL